MNKFFLFAGLLMISLGTLQGQKLSPVKWTFEMKKVGNENYEITASADINPGWTIYSQFTSDNGPIPTAFVVGDETVTFDEKSKSSKEHDAMFDVEVIKFKNKAIFTKIVKKTDKSEVSGYVTYMTCDGEKCLPPTDVPYTLKF